MRRKGERRAFILCVCENEKAVAFVENKATAFVYGILDL